MCAADAVTRSIPASRTIAQKMNWSLVFSTCRFASIARRHACTKASEPLVARKCTTPVLSSERQPQPTPWGQRS